MSLLAVSVQFYGKPSIVTRFNPAVFWPRPQVESAIVRITPSAASRAHVVEMAGNLTAFRTFLRDLYVHRRKNLRGALAGWPHGRRDKAEVDAKLAALGLPGTTRAEDLDAEQHRQLCAAFGD